MDEMTPDRRAALDQSYELKETKAQLDKYQEALRQTYDTINTLRQATDRSVRGNVMLLSKLNIEYTGDAFEKRMLASIFETEQVAVLLKVAQSLRARREDALVEYKMLMHQSTPGNNLTPGGG